MPYPIKDIPDIDDGVVAMLKTQGIRSTASLLEKACTLKQRRVLAEKTGLDARKLLCWANGADRMRVKGVSREYAELLAAAGVDTVKDLKVRNPAKLAQAMAEANRKRKLVRLLPSESVVTRWIENAKCLPLKIKY
ncbi:MAG TPA: DUF4332 domain-containing protein [Pseudolabrys sp.]|jgi:hypothetical protein